MREIQLGTIVIECCQEDFTIEAQFVGGGHETIM